MKAVFVLFDSLNRHALGAYGATGIATPNFDRFAARGVTFDNHFVGSMPCMPARRELHTGRLNFLHRSWGPLEPFDNSLARLLRDNGCYTHMVTDHCHYWMEGGATYHAQYSSFDFIRGQEKDRWKAMAQPPMERFREMYHPIQAAGVDDDRYLPHYRNRESIREEADFPLAGCFASAFEFLDGNRDADNWLLHLECFDPHEPFWAPERFRERHRGDYAGPILDWPRYDRVRENADEVAEINNNYAALVEMCDEYFGRLLDYFDQHDLWRDTALIVTTDHGFLLGEHDWWAKNVTPYYNEVAHIPLIFHHPDFPDQAGTRRSGLTQTPDLMPTLLDLFGIEIPEDVTARSLVPMMANPDRGGHDAVLYGIFGGAVNITDGRYAYFLYPPDMKQQDIYEYTLMPSHLGSMFTVEELRPAALSDGFDFTKGVPVLKIPARKAEDGNVAVQGIAQDTTTVLYDLAADPNQLAPIVDPDPAIIDRLQNLMVAIMRQHDAPDEAFGRIGMAAPAG